MNVWQHALEYRARLAAVRWADGLQELVFGEVGVRIVSVQPNTDDLPEGWPWCLVIIGSGSADDDEPDLITQTFSIVPCALVEGDPMGEHALIGGAREGSEVGTSAMRGVLELEERVRSAVADLTGADGTPVKVSAAGSGGSEPLAPGLHIAFRPMEVEAVCTGSLEWRPPHTLQSVVVGPNVNLSWLKPNVLHGYVEDVVVRKAGSVPPADVTDGTEVYRGTADNTVDAPGVGTWAYAVFAGYSMVGGTTSQVYSSVLPGTTRVATVT